MKSENINLMQKLVEMSAENLVAAFSDAKNEYGNFITRSQLGLSSRIPDLTAIDEKNKYQVLLKFLINQAWVSINSLTQKSYTYRVLIKLRFFSKLSEFDPIELVSELIKQLCLQADNIKEPLTQDKMEELRNLFSDTLAWVVGHADDPEIIELLIEHGAVANLKHKNGIELSELVDKAAIHSKWDSVAILAKAKTAIEKDEGQYSDVLFRAVHYNQKVAAKILLESGVKVPLNRIDEKGNGILHYAAFHNASEIVELLIESGADINAKNKFKLRPIQIAFHYGATEFIEAIKELTHYELETKLTEISAESLIAAFKQAQDDYGNLYTRARLGFSDRMPNLDIINEENKYQILLNFLLQPDPNSLKVYSYKPRVLSELGFLDGLSILEQCTSVLKVRLNDSDDAEQAIERNNLEPEKSNSTFSSQASFFESKQPIKFMPEKKRKHFEEIASKRNEEIRDEIFGL